MNLPYQRLLAVGDIHGHLDKLTRLMEVVAPATEDKVVFLGDYLDRGPQSRGVVEYLLSFRERFPQTVFLRGNHEQMLLDALVENFQSGLLPERQLPDWRLRDRSWLFEQESNHSDWNILFMNDGKSTLDSYGGSLADIPQEHIDFLAGLPMYHLEIADDDPARSFLFVHAGLRPKVPLEQQDLYDLLWIREEFIASNYHWSDWVVVHGHTPNIKVPTQAPQRICVDSGVYKTGESGGRKWGRLTCCDVLTRRIWQTDN
jgi:serine/threonine protein phosphatase 1